MNAVAGASTVRRPGIRRFHIAATAHLMGAVLTALLMLAPLALAKENPAKDDKNPIPPGESILRLLPEDSVTRHSVETRNGTLNYTTTAGTLPLRGQKGEQRAAVFYTAYTLDDADAAKRPLTFVFNGGPGAASAYLHIGLAGPRIVSFGRSGRDGAAATVVDNPDTWLAFTDLVMIDPVGTGWSRASSAEDARAFWSIDKDAESLAKVIALYTARNGRSGAPKFILGESYGGFRAVKIARALQNEHGIVPSGLVLVSPLIESSLLWGGQQFALGAALGFPSLVASHLERTGTATPEEMAEAERFALTDYLAALAGRPPSGEKAKALYDTIARMTGIPFETVERTRGLGSQAFMEQARARGEIASLYDGAFTSPNPFPESLSGRREPDPVLDGFSRALSGAFSGYARSELNYKTDLTYLLLNNEVTRRWEWGDVRRPPGVSGDLRILLSLNPSLQVWTVHGRSDLVTPYGVSRYLLDRLAPATDRIGFTTYRGGHMFYFEAEQRRMFADDARAFYSRVTTD